MRFPHLYSLVKPLSNLEPKMGSTGDVDNGADIDLVAVGQFDSGLALCQIGAATGAPTSFSVAWKIQDSTDGVTWVDVAGASLTMTAAGVGKIDFFPSQLKEHVRLVRSVTITGGTSPRVPSAGVILLGGGRTIPA